jgi:hypothetical protein
LTRARTLTRKQIHSQSIQKLKLARMIVVKA